MAAATPTTVHQARQLRWPRWIVAVGDRPSDDCPGMTRTMHGQAGARRAMSLFDVPDDAGTPTATSSSHVLVFDGILYNGGELRSWLGADGAGLDDAEVLLAAYRRHGDDFLRKVRGLFALVIWDADRDRLVCARDAMGSYPLYWTRSGGQLLVSPSLDDLLRHPSVSRALNRPAIADYFIDHWPRKQETFYAAIKRIPPGSALRSEHEGETVLRHWDPHPADPESSWLREDELGRFDELLTNAVDRFLEFGRPAIFLSGGFDSVSIATVAADECRRMGLAPPHALSLTFPDPEADEEFIQRGVARTLELTQDMASFDVACGPRGFLAGAIELSAAMPLPLQNFWLTAYNHLGRLGRERGCNIAFTGSGGDEWLDFTPFLAADLMCRLDFRTIYYLFERARRSYRLPARSVLWSLIWQFNLRAILRDAAIRNLRSRAPRMWSAAIRRHLKRLIPPWVNVGGGLWDELCRRSETSETERATESGEYGIYFAECRRTLDHPLISWEMEEAFENGRRLGMRILHPYQDAQLIELLYRVPPRLLDRDGRSKGLVRKRVADRFPDLGFERQKKAGVATFFASLMRAQGPRAWQELGGGKALCALGLADRDDLGNWMARLTASDQHRDAFKANAIMMMESWLQPRL